MHFEDAFIRHLSILLTVCWLRAGMLSPRGQHGLKAKKMPNFFGLVVSGLGLILDLVQRWPRSHLGWPLGLVVNHQNLVMNESQPSATEYLSASSSEYSHSCQ